MKYLPPKPYVMIQSSLDLHDFQDDVDEDAEVASSARDLTFHLDSPFSFNALRHCLLSCIHVVDLVLILPPDVLPNLLVGVRLHQLQLFKTNLPHRFLPAFLTSHDTITDLCLGGCDPARAADELCPLRFLNLSHIGTIECALECTAAVAHPALSRLAVEYMGDPCPDAPTVLRSLACPLATLFTLTLDFYPDDYDLVDQIVLAVPRLQNLKLLEKPRTFGRDGHSRSSRRVWNHASRWSKSLFRLDRLKDLRLRTAATFTGLSTSLDTEQATVIKWSTKMTRPSPSTVLKHSHPALMYLRVWYRCEQPGGGILTSWSKGSGRWKNVGRMLNTPPDQPF
ncbi:hypothetical protein C8Q76DRAFT_788965 [Earliella scabrosa]|nr:hypothetical protein C8Q76DRAFT_788965 [Earliella scabrosa]